MTINQASTSTAAPSSAEMPAAAPAGSAAARAIPGPHGQPILGSMSEFQHDRLGFMTRLQTDYGGVAQFRVANLSMIQVTHPDGVQRILQDNNHNYVRGALYASMRAMAGNGLPFNDGDFWLRQRRLMQPSFHRARVDAFGSLITAAAQAMLQRWEPAARSGQPLDVAAELTRLTMVVVAQALFGQAVYDEEDAIGSAISTVLDDMAYRFDVPFYPPTEVPTPRNRRFLAARRLIDQTLYRVIEERRARLDDDSPDLLSLLLHARDEDTGQGMTSRQLRDEVLALFVAGHETTAASLAWAVALLSQHPAVERQLRAELSQALAGRAPTVDDLPRLPYNRMVLEETLRLYPAAWIFNRTAVAADEIMGFHIPAGAAVVLSPYVTHRHPEFWPNPEGFDPERFAPGQSDGRPRFAHFPFGGGPHQCIGAGFALLEAQLVLASLLQRYRLDLVPGHRLEPLPRVTLRPKDGVLVTLRPA